MFYAQFVLSKKGPLAKIWLAAHWEKKLSKAQIYETSIEDAVEEITKPKVKIALRTTGHLLLGIVRIYSRKTKYLLADCNEAFLKIKVSLRPGAFDLLEEREEEGPKMLLPEVAEDFDAAEAPDYDDVDFAQQVVQSRMDDITLRDDFMVDGGGATLTGGYDDFGDLDFGNGGLARPHDESAFGDDVNEFGLTAADYALMEEESERLEHARDGGDASMGGLSSSHHSRLRDMTPMVEGLEAPGKNVFGDEDFATDGHDDHMDHGDDVHYDAGGDDYRGGDDENPGSEHVEGDDAASVVTDAQFSSFALDPLEEQERIRRAPRRRRLVVDDYLTISGDEMKAQMADYSDTLASLDLAPPTRVLMRCRERGAVDKLTHLPASTYVRNRGLIRFYQSHLIPRVRTAFGPAHLHDASLNETIEEIRRDLDYVDEIEDFEGDANSSLQNDDYDMDILPPPMQDDYDNFDGPEDIVGTSIVHHDDEPAAAVEPPEKKRKTKMDTSHDADETVDHAAEGDGKWTKRTQAVFNQINTKLNASDEGEITFTDLVTKATTRKAAAQKFYQLLVLKKCQAIEISQMEPYGDIHISAGPNIESVNA